MSGTQQVWCELSHTRDGTPVIVEFFEDGTKRVTVAGDATRCWREGPPPSRFPEWEEN